MSEAPDAECHAERVGAYIDRIGAVGIKAPDATHREHHGPRANGDQVLRVRLPQQGAHDLIVITEEVDDPRAGDDVDAHLARTGGQGLHDRAACAVGHIDRSGIGVAAQQALERFPRAAVRLPVRGSERNAELCQLMESFHGFFGEHANQALVVQTIATADHVVVVHLRTVAVVDSADGRIEADDVLGCAPCPVGHRDIDAAAPCGECRAKPRHAATEDKHVRRDVLHLQIHLLTPSFVCRLRGGGLCNGSSSAKGSPISCRQDESHGAVAILTATAMGERRCFVALS